MNPEFEKWQKRISRRALLKGAVVGSAGLAAAAIVGCGGDDKSANTPVSREPSIVPKETSLPKETPNPKEGILDLGEFQLGIQSWEEHPHHNDEHKVVVIEGIIKNVTQTVVSNRPLIIEQGAKDDRLILEGIRGRYPVLAGRFFGSIPMPTIDLVNERIFFYDGTLDVPPGVGLSYNLLFEVPKTEENYWLVGPKGKVRNGEIATNFPFKEPELRIRNSNESWQIPGLATVNFKGLLAKRISPKDLGLFASFEIRNDASSEMRIRHEEVDMTVLKFPFYDPAELRFREGPESDADIEIVPPGPIGRGAVKTVNFLFSRHGNVDTPRKVLESYQKGVVFLQIRDQWAAWRPTLILPEAQPLLKGTPEQLMTGFLNKMLKAQFRPGQSLRIARRSPAVNREEELQSDSWKVGDAQIVVKYFQKSE